MSIQWFSSNNSQNTNCSDLYAHQFKSFKSLLPQIVSTSIIEPVSEIKDFSDAHIGCMDPKTMHPAKYLCTFPYMSILTVQKRHGF